MATLEIRELVIRATIVPEGSGSQASPATSSHNNNVSPNEELINTCVEKILEIIKEKNGR
jgi:hypothetical protein